MKDIKKTAIIIGVTCITALVALLIVNNAQYGVELLTKTSLSKNDPTIIIALDKLNKLTNLRTANFKPSNMSSEEVIEFAIDNLESNEYNIKKITPKKIICEVTDTIHFQTEESQCTIKVIKNSAIKNLEETFFNNSTVSEYPEIEYHGHHCKNDGTKYYCLISDYQNSILEYSLFDSAYQEKDKVVIREYYLRIDSKDNARCKKYLDKEYCDSANSKDKPELNEETIKKDGVLYEHIFKETDSSYYLEESRIVTSIKSSR